MFFRKYLAFVETTFPWVFCCCITWWLDRLFVEFGHRASDSPTCHHSDIQYMRLHQYVTVAAVCAQTGHSIYKRKQQFKRELTLVGVITYKPCLWHLYIVQSILCIAWTTILVCLVDVSPWLCIETILGNRASISTAAFGIVLLGLVLERTIWQKTLDRAVELDPDTIDI
jgi:hypothetical protein